MNDDIEVLSLVDQHDTVVGTILRSETDSITPKDALYIRCVNAFLVRDDHKIWIPTRALHKKIAPDGIDYSVGAHVKAGEDYTDALMREFLEEAGINVSLNDCVEIAYNTPDSIGNNTLYFNKLYIVQSSEHPTLSKEHTSGEFMNIDEIINKVEYGAVTKHHYLEDLLVLQSYLRNAEKTPSTKRLRERSEWR